MINSVGEYVAGQDYDLRDELADHFIVLGYASGELTRDFSSEELDALREAHQEVSV